MKKGNGHEELSTKVMLSKPITPLARLIGEKWFLPLAELAERAGMKEASVVRAVNGEKIYYRNEKRLREYLENYKGESV